MKIIFFITALILSTNAYAQNITPGTAGQGAKVQKSWNSMTPEEQSRVKSEALNRWQNMTPAQQQSMKNQALKHWQGMTPQQKAQVQSQAKSAISNMTAEEKAALVDEATKLTPEEQRNLEQSF